VQRLKSNDGRVSLFLIGQDVFFLGIDAAEMFAVKKQPAGYL
jgi:hypothetical protein